MQCPSYEYKIKDSFTSVNVIAVSYFGIFWGTFLSRFYGELEQNKNAVKTKNKIPKSPHQASTCFG